jgi:hypothetical protein
VRTVLGGRARRGCERGNWVVVEVWSGDDDGGVTCINDMYTVHGVWS